MADDPIPPALSAEEWAEALRPPVGVYNLTAGEGDPQRQAHKTAALCLHGQRFGFDTEDVELLRREAAECQRLARWCPEGYVRGLTDAVVDADRLAQAARWRSLASRIEALLPPEEEAAA